MTTTTTTDGKGKGRTMTPEARALAEHPASLEVVRRWALRSRKMYPLLCNDFDSSFSDLMLAMVRAAETFNPACGASWETYLCLRLRTAVIDHLRTLYPRGYGRALIKAQKIRPPRVAHLSVTRARGRDGKPVAPEFVFESPDLPVGWEIEACDEVRGLAEGLPPAYRDTVVAVLTEARYARMQDYGAAVGVSESRVSQRITEARAMIRDDLARREGGTP